MNFETRNNSNAFLPPANNRTQYMAMYYSHSPNPPVCYVEGWNGERERQRYKNINVSSITFLTLSEVYRRKASTGNRPTCKLYPSSQWYFDWIGRREMFREARQGNAAGWAAYTSGVTSLPSFGARGKIINTNQYISLSACPYFLNP